MSSGFGFVARPQRPAPDPQEVGRALAQAGMQMDAPRTPVTAEGGPEMDDMEFGTAYTPAGRPGMAARLRLLGAIRTGGAGQTGTGSAPAGQPDYEAGPLEADHSLVNAGVGEALTRLGGGLMRNASLGAEQAARRRADLLRLGLTPFEVALLQRSGGI